MSNWFDCDLSKDDAELLAFELKQLFEQQGWAIFKEFVATRVAGYKLQLVDAPPSSMEELIRWNRLHGGASELDGLCSMFEQTLEDIELELKKLFEEADDEAPEEELNDV
jgi:hypothetical protein